MGSMGGLVAAYLFLGGTAAGAFFWAALAPRLLGSGPEVRAAEPRTLAVTLGLLVVGSLCLVCDLGRSSAIFSMFFSGRLNYMTAGAWSLIALMGIIVALLAVGPGRTSQPHQKPWRHQLRTALLVSGTLLSLYLMVYTGLLLRLELGVDLWSTDALPVLFVASSLTAGLALYALCARSFDIPGGRGAVFVRRIARLEVSLLAAEVVAILLYIWTLMAAPFGRQALSVLFAGESLALFAGGFLAVGIAVPIAADIIELRAHGGEVSCVLASTAGIVGALCLRYALVQAGVNILF